MTSDAAPHRDRRRFLRLAGGGMALAALAATPRTARGQTAGGTHEKIGMIGAGREGSALGTLFVKAGHPVMFSSRHPDRLKDLAASLGPLAQAGTVGQAVAFGDVVVVVVPYSAIEEIGKAHAGALATKVLVMDVSNPIARRDGEALAKAVNDEGGPGLMTAKLLPGARIVRAFNAVGADRMGQAHAEPGRVGMPIAGDDEEALDIASTLIREIGYEPVRIGGLEMGKYLMPGTPLAGERTPEEVRKVAATLQP